MHMYANAKKVCPCQTSKITKVIVVGHKALENLIYQTRAYNERNEHKLPIANILGKPECLEA